MARSRRPPSSRFTFSIKSSEISSWRMPRAMVLSSTCENGPCPTSCSKMAIFTASASSSVISTPLPRNALIASVIKKKAPKECWNLVCCAPGYTMQESPNCLIRCRRCIMGCVTTSMISPLGIFINPKTGSLMILPDCMPCLFFLKYLVVMIVGLEAQLVFLCG